MLIVIATSNCGGGGGGSPSSGVITEIELRDPTPGAGDQFGHWVVKLSNGNVVISDPFDSSVIDIYAREDRTLNQNGAVHLFDPATQALLASYYGSSSEEQLGDKPVAALPNGNFVISSPNYSQTGKRFLGKVLLLNGQTGEKIGEDITGDNEIDLLGNDGVYALANSNFVIASSYDDVGGVFDTGSVRLVDGSTGLQIGRPIVGEMDENLGNSGIKPLPNGNYVVVSHWAHVGDVNWAGWIKLVDGKTGVQIGDDIEGNATFDTIQGSYQITVLANNNFVIFSPEDDENGIVDAGSARLFNGESAEQIGSSIIGDKSGDFSHLSQITKVSNNNFVLSLSNDDDGVIEKAGSVRLINGETGIQVGNLLKGDSSDDKIAGNGVVALFNGNYVFGSEYDDVNDIVDVGSATLVDGTTGNPIKVSEFGHTTPLLNGNYIATDFYKDANGIEGAGTIKLIDGFTGDQIGNTISGDNEYDYLGSDLIAVLANDNFVIVSNEDDVDGLTDVGSVMLVDGVTGNLIGEPIIGEAAGNLLYHEVTTLSNNNFVLNEIIDTEFDPEIDADKEVVDNGLMKLIDGETGLQIGKGLRGNFSGDMDAASIVELENEAAFILSLSKADRNGLKDSGFVGIVKN